MTLTGAGISLFTSCPFTRNIYMQRDNEPFEMLMLDRYTGEIVDKVDQAQEFQGANVIGYRGDVVLFYLKNIDVGAIVFYQLASKQVIKTL